MRMERGTFVVSLLVGDDGVLFHGPEVGSVGGGVQLLFEVLLAVAAFASLLPGVRDLGMA